MDTGVRLAWALVTAALLLDVLLVGQHALVRYQAYHADAFDLGNMDQAVWNTLHGHPFRFTNRGNDWLGPPTRLGIHVEPILLLIAPLYLIHAGPETLLVVQTLALALGGLPLFLLARRRLPDLPQVGVAFVLAYLVTPQLLGEALWDFHPVALATPLLLTAIWALDARRYGWFAVAAVLAALTKEDVALSLVPLGLWLWLRHGRPRMGQLVIALSLLWTALCFFVILPHFSGGASGGNNYWYRYAWLGSSPGAAVINLLTHPWLPIQYALSDAGRRGYIAATLRLGGGLGLFAPLLWICGLPELAVNLLSTHSEQYSGFFQYNAMLIAYFTAASVYGAAALYEARKRAEVASMGKAEQTVLRVGIQQGGILGLVRQIAAAWRNALERLPLPSQVVGRLLMLWLVVVSLWSLLAADKRLSSFWQVGAGPIPQQTAIDALLARVPVEASVAATDTLDPHLSARYTIYLMPDSQSYAAEYVAVDIPAAIAESQSADLTMYGRMRSSGRYQVVGTVGAVVLLKRIGQPLVP